MNTLKVYFSYNKTSVYASQVLCRDEVTAPLTQQYERKWGLGDGF